MRPADPGAIAERDRLAGIPIGPLSDRIGRRLDAWTKSGAADRLWRHDPSLWPEAPPADVETRLDWLALPDSMQTTATELATFAEAVRAEGFERVVVLGMGGSSLAPWVFANTFSPAAGFPRLEVLDSTHPGAVRRIRDEGHLDRTLFVVSSKSGTTLEPNVLFRYFERELDGPRGTAGAQFVAITDPGTPLESLAHERKFRHVFLAPPGVGGRYSALTVFGLVPASLTGLDVAHLLARARRMARACGETGPAARNPGLLLGATLGELALAGRDKVVFLTSAALGTFPIWAEQLIAESTGKIGKGVVPVAGEVRPLDPMGEEDRVLVHLRLRGQVNSVVETQLTESETAGTPVLRFELEELADLAAEFFRWEVAVAMAGSVIGINPFDQPDVELAKELARKALGPETGRSPSPGVAPLRLTEREALGEALSAWGRTARPGDYVALQAYLAPNEAADAGLEALRVALRKGLRVATTLGYGPRFLHSTGQLHKGGPPTGLFLQLVDAAAPDLLVPGEAYGFQRIVHAQARGDAEALRQKDRRIARVDLGLDPVAGLGSLTDVVTATFSRPAKP